MNDPKILVKYDNEQVRQKAKMKFAKPGDAGFDLYNAGETITIYPGTSVEVPAGISVKIPDNYVGFLRNRSSTFAKRGLFVVHNTIDSGYTGPMFTHVWYPVLNGRCKPIEILPWERLGQLVIVPYLSVPVEEVESLPATSRGVSGFGSTGK